MKKMFAVFLVLALLLAGCAPKLPDITEQELLDFYASYVEGDVFKYLVYKTFADVERDGIPYYVLAKMGVACEIGYLETFGDQYASAEERAVMERYKQYDSAEFYVFKPADVQAFADSVWGAGRLDVADWYAQDPYLTTGAGYIFACSFATGFYDFEWYKVAGVELNGQTATLLVYCLDYYEYAGQLRNLAVRSYVADDSGGARLGYTPVANYELDTYGGAAGPDFDEIVALAGIDLETLEPMRFAFYMTAEGVRLQDSGPIVDAAAPQQQPAEDS